MLVDLLADVRFPDHISRLRKIWLTDNAVVTMYETQQMWVGGNVVPELGEADLLSHFSTYFRLRDMQHWLFDILVLTECLPYILLLLLWGIN